MANNILSAQINVTAPNIANTTATVSKATDKMAASLKKVAPASNQATTSLSNLGRIVQDAPFGFIGITNNINPLVESFQRLKASTGTTGGALKALGSSLVGAGGVGLAFSAVSTALVLFGDKLFGTGRKAKAAADAIKESNKQLSESVAQDLVKLTSLVAVIQNVNTSQEDRSKALRAVNKEYGQYLSSLDKEKLSLETIGAAYDKIIEGLLRQAVVKGLQKEIEQSVSKTAESILKAQKAQANSAVQAQKDADAKKQQAAEVKDLSTEYNKFNRVVTDGVLAQTNSNRELTRSIGNANNLDEAIVRLKEQLKKELFPLFTIMEDFKFDDLGFKLDPTKDDSKDIIAQAKRIFDAYKDIIDLKLTIRADDDIKTQLQKAQDFLSRYARGAYKLTVPVGISIDEKDIVRPQEVKPAATAMADMFGKEMSNYFTQTDPIDFGLIQAVNDDKTKAKVKTAAEILGQAFTDALMGAFTSGFASIGEGLGNILSGKDFGASLINVIGSLLQELGKALIQYGAIKQGLDKILGPGGFAIPGGVAIGLGVAAIAIGQAFKNFGGFRAAGGPVSSGQGYIVGEKGPEWFQPGVSGSIVPNHAMGGVGMAAAAGGKVVFEIQGNKLVGVLANATRYQSRNT